MEGSQGQVESLQLLDLGGRIIPLAVFLSILKLLSLSITPAAYAYPSSGRTTPIGDPRWRIFLLHLGCLLYHTNNLSVEFLPFQSLSIRGASK